MGSKLTTLSGEFVPGHRGERAGDSLLSGQGWCKAGKVAEGKSKWEMWAAWRARRADQSMAGLLKGSALVSKPPWLPKISLLAVCSGQDTADLSAFDTE